MNINDLAKMNNLTDEEVLIIDEIIKRIQKGEYKIAIREIASMFYVSTTSIVRLAKKLGYESYSEMLFGFKHQCLSPIEYHVPGVVKGIGMAINAFTQPGDKILIQTPVYHPFRMTIEGNNRQVVLNPLKESTDGSFYQMDFEGLEKNIVGCKMMILCNPHNPGGIQWNRATLERVAQICHKHGVIVMSDEIHADLALFGHKHIPFATVSKEAEEISITFQAPTKTFNMAGIVSSYAIVANPELRQRLFHWMGANELNEPHVFAPIATIAAFKYGEEWRQQMLAYIEQNILFTEEFFKAHIPGIKVIRPESSFLVWLDCRPLHLNHDDLQDLFVNKARLALNDGEIFDTAQDPYAPLHQQSSAGRGFMRLNIGTPRSILAQALKQLAEAVASL